MHELKLTAPLGFECEPIGINDLEGLRAAAMGMSDDTEFKGKIAKENIEGLQKFFTDNGFTFE